VVPIGLADVDRWLYGTVDEARELLPLAELEALDGQPVI
jgi:hypothetical protein